MSSLQFRDALQKDLPVIVAIYNSTVASRMVTADTEPVTVESRQQWFEAHSTTKRPLWIIENDLHEIIGWVSFQSFYGRPAYDATAEVSIYITSEQRGKGLGKIILQHCINNAHSLGITTLLGYIFAHNKPSIKLFTQLGFSEWALLPNIAVLDGQERSLKILGKRIV
jgi:phosphinothricin acetyltransferase